MWSVLCLHVVSLAVVFVLCLAAVYVVSLAPIYEFSLVPVYVFQSLILPQQAVATDCLISVNKQVK